MKRVRRFASSEKGLELFALAGVLLGALLFPRPKRKTSQSANKFPFDLDSDGELRVPMSELTDNSPTNYSFDNSVQSVRHRDSHKLKGRHVFLLRILGALSGGLFAAYCGLLAAFIVTGKIWVVILMVGVPFGIMLVMAGINPSRQRRKQRK